MEDFLKTRIKIKILTSKEFSELKLIFAYLSKNIIEFLLDVLNLI